MPAELIWSPQADEDLVDIHAFIALDNPDAADRTVDRIASAAELLRHYPRLCPRRADIRQSLRVFTQRPYLLVYQTIPDTDDEPVDSVIIIRVIDGRRDLQHPL